MADAMDTLKSILGDDAEDKIRGVMGSLSAGDSGNFANNNANSRNDNLENLEYLMQMKDIMSKLTNSHNDSRSNLLMSLRPYMRDNKKRSIDSAIKLLNISKLAGLFKM